MPEFSDPRSSPAIPDEGQHNDGEYVMATDPLAYQDAPAIGYGESSIAKEHRHPFTPYLCSPIRRIVNGTADSFPLDFKANTVTVSNYSPQWLYIDSANFWVPPRTVGWIIRCVQASDEGRAYWGAPPGYTQPPSVTGALAVVQWLEETIDQRLGVPLEVLPQVPNAVQVSVGIGATQILPANGSRTGGAVITNPSSSVTVFIGGSGVTTSTGQELLPLQSLSIAGQEAIYGIVVASTQTVSALEETS